MKTHPQIKTYSLRFFLLVLTIQMSIAQGPNAPEAASFEPVDATDMVNLVTGDLSYVLPLLNVPSPEGGYPIALSYHAGIAMEREASWVGLGWSLNPGAVNRSVNGYPDDWGKTRVSELYYDKGGSTDYYSFSIGGTLPNGLTLGVSKSWGGYRAWGGVVGYLGQSINFGSEGFGFQISHGPLSYYASSDGSSGVGISYQPSGKNSETGKPNNPNGLGANLGYNFDTKSFSIGASSKKAGIGITFKTSQGGSLSTSGLGATTQSTSSNQNDYFVKTTSKGFNVSVGFYWASYRHTNVSYSLFKNNVLMPSGILNTFDFRINKSLPRSGKDHEIMDMKQFYADDDDYAFYTHSEYQFSNQPAISLPNYDNYSVSAQGIGGSISPRIFDEVTLVHKNFYEKNDDYSSERNTRVSVEYYQQNFSNQNQFKLGNKLHFYFDNVNSSFLRTSTGDFDFTHLTIPTATSPVVRIQSSADALSINTSTDTSYSSTTTIDGNIKKVGNRKRDGNFIETFTTRDIKDGNTNGWFIEAKSVDFRRYSTLRTTNEVNDESIGAYRITALDGKVYHYSLPVYHYESIFKSFEEGDDENSKFFRSKKMIPYATHWLLTAITGPDYVDVNSNGELDESDYGYWIEFEYGKWSGGFGWKSPKEGYKTHQNKSNYFMGIKELYYLDQIKTRTHTALFVKSIREDCKSYPISEYNQKWTGNLNDAIFLPTYSDYLYDKQFKSHTLSGDFHLKTIYTQQPYIDESYNRKTFNNSKEFITTYMDVPLNYSLKLDKILILKNEDIAYDKTIVNAISSNRKVGHTYHNSGYTNYKEQPYVNKIAANASLNSPISPNFHLINMDKYVLDTDDLTGLGLEEKAIKIISFNYDYSLGGNLPNSTSGQLSLKEIHTKGRSGVQLIPPFKFEYAKSGTPYNKDNQDVWGYVVDNPDAWSLNKIKTPLGGEIKIEYESDSFYAEAAYRTNVSAYQRIGFNTNVDYFLNNIIGFEKGSDYLRITLDESEFDFNILNDIEETVTIFSKGKYYYINGSRNINIKNIYSLESIDYNDHSILLRVNELTDLTKHTQIANKKCTSTEWPQSEVDNCLWDLHFSLNSHPFNNLNGKEGGGVRIKNIIVRNDNKSYKTNYDYRNPVTNRISGITSYEPWDGGNKTVPYIQEIPAPNVLYSNVCVSTLVNNVPENITKYTFQTLEPFNLSENEDLLYNLGEDFKVSRSVFYDIDAQGAYENANSPGTTGIKIYKHTIHNSLSNIGNLLSVKKINLENQLLSSSINNYISNDHNLENHRNGIIQESFKVYKKRRRNFNGINTGNLWTDRTYNISSTSKINYPSVLESTTTTQGGFTSTTNFVKHDFLTGQVLETTTTDSKGNRFKTELIPAYTIPEYGSGDYSMGSKVDNPTNKNMLSQQAMSKTYMNVAGDWKETGVGITTWNNNWNYMYYNGSSTTETVANKKIWRKHKSFIWDGALNEDGSYQGFVGEDDNFDWGIASAGSETVQSNPKWKNISTTIQYDHYSMPLEVRDINGNYAATKMGDANSKVFMSANAKYGECFYTGAEDPLSGSFIGQQIKLVNGASRVSTYAHTGTQSIQIASGNSIHVDFISGKYRPGNYKVSVWVKKDNAANVRVGFGSAPVPFNGEQITAGDWVQLNHYMDLNGSSGYINITSNNGNIYADDLRVHPIASSMTSYVYNEWDELWYIIGTNGLASKFEYDAAGRLIKTYSEIIDTPSVPGGFKTVSKNYYNYGN